VGAFASGLLLAALPDPANPSFIPIAATVGGIITGTNARIRGKKRRVVREAVELGAYWGGVVGILMYVSALIADLTVL
jgi:hypothetical protein